MPDDSNYAAIPPRAAPIPPPTLPPSQIQYVPGGTVPPPTAAPAIPSPSPTLRLVQNQDSSYGPLAVGSASQGGNAPTEGDLRGDSPTGRIPPEKITDYFVQKGLTPAQAKGMTRAFMEESGGNPDAFNPAGGGQGAAGLAQWRADRQRRLIAQYGPRPTAQQQLDFAWQELNTTEKPAFEAVKSASTESGAYDAFRAKFERPGPPAGEMKAGATPTFQEFIQRNEETQQRESGMLQQLMAEAEKETPGSRERQQKMQQAMEHSERLARAFEDIAAHPPTEKPVDMMQNFGSLASVIALAGGLFSRRPLTAALGAAGSAMEAMNTNNHEQFERSYKQWHDQTSLVSQALSFQNQEINQIIADEKLTEGERQEKLMDAFRLYGMQHQIDQAALGNWVQVYQLTNAAQKAQVDLDKTLAQASFYRARTAQMSGAGGGQLDQATLSQMADQYIAGDKSVLQGLGYGNAGAANRAALRTAVSQKEMSRATQDFEKKNGRPPTDAEKEGLSADIGRKLAIGIAEYGGLQQAERSGFNRIAGITLAAAEAQKFTPLAKQASESVDRTRYPNFNKIELAVMEGTGSTAVINFYEANVALIDAYAQVIGRGNSQLTDAARSQATNLLNTNWSKGQYNTAVDAINREIAAALQAPKEMLGTLREGFGVRGELPKLSLDSGATAAAADYKTSGDVVSAYKAGTLSRDDAAKILREHGWAQ